MFFDMHKLHMLDYSNLYSYIGTLIMVSDGRYFQRTSGEINDSKKKDYSCVLDGSIVLKLIYYVIISIRHTTYHREIMNE